MTYIKEKGSPILGVILFLVFTLHFGVFEQSPQNPIGIKFMQEVYLAVCLGFTVLFLAGSVGGKKPQYDIGLAYCLYAAFMFTFLVAVFGKMFYGQPLAYGLIEERRVLMCFSFFILLWLGERMPSWQFERTLLMVSLLAIVLSWLCYYELLPDMRDDDGNRDLSRPGRSAVGTLALVFGYCLCLYFWHKGKSPLDGTPRKHRLLYLVFGLACVMTIVFVTQTRQVLVLCAIFTVLCLRGKTLKLAAVACVLLMPLMIWPHMLDFMGVNLDFYIHSIQTGGTDEIRQNTIDQIFTHLNSNYWVPSGSLSLMWNEGFRNYFSYFFFLSDVGVFGTLFRFGALAFVVIPLSFFVYYIVAKRLNRSLDFVLPIFLAHLAIWPLQGMFEYLQGMTALLLATQALKTHYQRNVPRTLPQEPLDTDLLYRRNYQAPSYYS